MKRDLPALKPKDVITVLQKAGFVVKRQTGSHVILYKPGIKRPLTVPIHTRDLPGGTLRAIVRQANLTIAEFLALL